MKHLHQQFEEATNTLYKAIGITQPTQLIPHEIAERIGVELVYLPVETVAINETIYLDSRLSPQKQRQAFGREMYRILRHPSNQLTQLDEESRQWQEEASLFTLYACMPNAMVADVTLPSTEREGVKTLADAFNVTEELAAERLKLFKNLV